MMAREGGAAEADDAGPTAGAQATTGAGAGPSAGARAATGAEAGTSRARDEVSTGASPHAYVIP